MGILAEPVEPIAQAKHLLERSLRRKPTWTFRGTSLKLRVMALWSALFSRPAQSPVRPSQTLFFLLAGAFFLTLVPHVERFPLWLTAVVVLAMVIRSVLEFYRLPLPGTTFCGIVAICLSGGIFLQFHTVLGRDAGMALTAGLLAIKFYEVRGPRDVSLIIFSCFFVVMSALLYSQVVELFIYCLIMMWVLTALLIAGYADEVEPPGGPSGAPVEPRGPYFCPGAALDDLPLLFLPARHGKISIGPR